MLMNLVLGGLYINDCVTMANFQSDTSGANSYLGAAKVAFKSYRKKHVVGNRLYQQLIFLKIHVEGLANFLVGRSRRYSIEEHGGSWNACFRSLIFLLDQT